MVAEGSQRVRLIQLTADIMAAYVSQNHLTLAEVQELIGSVHTALVALEKRPASKPARPEPHIPIRRTVTPDFLISLEDGKPYRSLRRHLRARGMTPEAYRSKWGLPHDYPMVAVNYSQQRSQRAKEMGLSQFRRKARAK
ncbi:MucR family transcriptional regulator [Salinarimonas soli]|uniref:MucR family transcriptional regulator n=1 Tax=Salinarimonas soli TaxID=1638099 RepID=A0A5B2VDD5_9HYPH|nr:MucR family transcriptional regulator [Salinarimonas soli]KAA2237071.1 MucR family transcriptional regulator [Salinarimonas soli]